MNPPDPLTCPVCTQSFNTPKGLPNHFRHRRDAGDALHIAYETAQENARWEHLTEGADYVRCLECGHRTVTLARHLKGEHGITADQYRVKHGTHTPIRCDALKAKRGAAISARPITKGEVKQVSCPTCGGTWEGSKYLGAVHDLRCPVCREREWEGKSEPQDFVTCRVCGHRAENLTSHITKDHPHLLGTYRNAYPGAELVALCSPVRDKMATRGVPRSFAFKLRVSQGKLASGFRHSARSRAMMSTSQKAVGRTVLLSMSVLGGFRLMNGKISVGKAMSGLGRCREVIRRECIRHGLAYHNCLVSQDRFLGILSRILGCEPHREWSSDMFVNPRSGRRFKFDGYWESHNLLVEFQGYQHRVYPNRFHHTEEDFIDAQWRDDEKRRQVAVGTHRYLEVHDHEPWGDETYLRERLRALGLPV